MFTEGRRAVFKKDMLVLFPLAWVETLKRGHPRWPSAVTLQMRLQVGSRGAEGKREIYSQVPAPLAGVIWGQQGMLAGAWASDEAAVWRRR